MWIGMLLFYKVDWQVVFYIMWIDMFLLYNVDWHVAFI